jgi:hypothetical protein
MIRSEGIRSCSREVFCVRYIVYEVRPVIFDGNLDLILERFWEPDLEHEDDGHKAKGEKDTISISMFVTTSDLWG